MRNVPAALAEHLAGEATTLAHAFIVRLVDGTTFGFTDHDRQLTVAGVVCHPDSGFEGSTATHRAGFAVGEEEITGLLSANVISESDLTAGRWDGAMVDVYRVNWQTPADCLKLRTGRIGEVVQRDGEFRAELRGPAHALTQTRGRLYSRQCDAAFGDNRCHVDVASWRRTTSVASGSEARFVRLAGVADLTAGWLDRGTCRFEDGALSGKTMSIESHVVEAGVVGLMLRHPLPVAPEVGTVVTLTTGCDKQFTTCRDRFANVGNFRGFPHMPGRDFVFSFASSDSDAEVLFQ